MPPEIDVSDLLLDPDFVETIQLLRRAEVIGANGRMTTTNTSHNIIASVQPQTDQPMIRGPDQQNLPQLIAVITKFRLRGISPGFQPDLVLWNDTTFVVNKVYNWSHYGAGFVKGECSSMDHLDQPPDGTGWDQWASGSGSADDC
jgi:hypothetical protein